VSISRISDYVGSTGGVNVHCAIEGVVEALGGEELHKG